MKRLLLASLFFLTKAALATSFMEAVEIISQHDRIQEISSEASSFGALARSQASWDDPMMKVAAKNLPLDFKTDQTPMTGIELFMSQKIPISEERAHLESSASYSRKAKIWQSDWTKNHLLRLMWKDLISIRMLTEHQGILRDNIQWISKMIKISKKLYVNGKVSQQAILDLKIRRSELKTLLIEKEFGIQGNQESLKYLLGHEKSLVDSQTIPWKILQFGKKPVSQKDPKEQSLATLLLSKKSLVSAKDSAFAPDITVGAGYTKRADIDGHGDFISLVVQVPLTVSERRDSQYEKAIWDQKAAEARLSDYKQSKKSLLSRLEIKNEKLASEILIIQSESINFARNARDITAKAYRLGSASYMALLQSELKLQQLLIKRSSLQASKDLNTLEYKFVSGDKLHE